LKKTRVETWKRPVNEGRREAGGIPKAEENSEFLGSSEKLCWSRLEAAEAWPKAKATQAANTKERELGIMSQESYGSDRSTSVEVHYA
jgi:hypothetical protein